jgi:predicted TIM-barrel fold metal-dependent hydrolase
MAADLESLLADPQVPADRVLTLLDDPEPPPVWCPVISVDDHVLEPASLFDRVPERYRDEAPRMIEVDGRPAWLINGRRFFIHGLDAASGRPVNEAFEPAVRFDELRKGAWDVDARVADMTLNGVWASLNFASATWGFAGKTLSSLPDKDVAVACVQAYNDWMIEEWCGAYPERFIPCQLPYLADAEIAAQEIHRNAARGVHCVSFSENPQGLGFSSIHSGDWEPFFAACAETGTVINLHVGSSGNIQRPSPDSPIPVMTALFPINSVQASIDWVYSKVFLRHPDLKVVLSEGGATWVPMVIERLVRAQRRRAETGYWLATEPHPVDVFREHCWFASVEDPTAFHLLPLIGEDRIMIETDYPHPDSSWPNSQELFRSELDFLPEPTIRKICFETAAALYQHPLPPQDMIEAAGFRGQADVDPYGRVRMMSNLRYG